MAASVWFGALVDGTSQIVAQALNQLDIFVTRLIDGNAGGKYTPSSPLVINGDGISGTQNDTAHYGTYTFKTSGSVVFTPVRVALTSSDVTVMESATEAPVFLVTNTGAGATRTIVVSATGAAHGDRIRFSFVAASATHPVSINSPGATVNPIYQSDPTPLLAPDWVDLMFDKDVVDGNPLGQWVRSAHGRV